jgi:hypothetical protein
MELSKKLIDKAVGIFNRQAKKEKAFFDVPPSLKIVNATAAKSIQTILNGIKSDIESGLGSLNSEQIVSLGLGILLNELSDDNIKSYASGNKEIRQIKNHLGNSGNTSIASEITVACSNGDYYNSKLQNLEDALSIKPLQGSDYIQIALDESDFDQKMSDRSNYNGLENLYGKSLTLLPFYILSYDLFLKVKDYILNNRYPSKFRTFYLQNQVRQLGLLLKKAKNNIGSNLHSEIDSIFAPFKLVDSLIIGFSTASFLYLRNRGTGQEQSSKELEEISLSSNCVSFAVADDPSINKTPIDTSLAGFTCPLPDRTIVPHQPIEQKINNHSCDTKGEETDISISADPTSDIATKAIIENLSPSEEFVYYIQKGQKIENDTVIGKIGETLIYSSVTGYVEKIEPKSIWLRDISDVGNNIIEETTSKIKALYEELNNSKRFIKDFYLDSWYPPMLSSTPFVDPSLNTKPTVDISGIKNRWRNLKKRGNSAVDIFNKNIQKITGKDNIKTKAENNQLIEIKVEYDKEESILYKTLETYAIQGLAIARNTKIVKGDLVYLDYMLDLIEQLNSYDDQNNIVTSFSIGLNTFLQDRFFVEGRNLKEITDRINGYASLLQEGSFRFYKIDYYKVMTEKYESNKQSESAVRDYAVSLGKKNTEMTEDEKRDTVKNIVSLFNFSRRILQLQNLEKKYIPKYDIIQLSFKEGNYMKNYFDGLYKRLGEIPTEIDDLEKTLDDLGSSFVPPSIRTIDDEQYEWYGLLGPERTCPIPVEEDEYLSPYTAYDHGSIIYWLKYCAFATLASVANPGRGWATGIPPPVGPITLPVVYIPFKSFMTKWGFIVVGLTICGTYPFPWVLFGNLSSNYNTPFGDPAAALKNEIVALKKILSKAFKNFRQDLLKDYLERTAANVEVLNNEVEEISRNKRNHKTNKPVKDRSKNTLADRQSYIKSLAEWASVQAQYDEQLINAKANRYVVETKYKIVYDAYTEVSPIQDAGVDPTLITMEKSQKSLDSQLENLNSLVDKINNILIPLPISMKPETANFGITAKNPRPIIKIKENVATDLNVSGVDKIIGESSLKSEDFMSNKFGETGSQSISGNFKKYKKELSLAKFTLVPSDPFPKYENLSPANLAWIPFLYNNFTVVGAKTYGYPGFLPLPIG